MLKSSIVCHYEVHMVEELVEHVWEGFCDNTKSHLNLSLRHFCMYFPLFFPYCNIHGFVLYPHLIEKETETRNLNDLPNGTKLKKAEIEF